MIEPAGTKFDAPLGARLVLEKPDGRIVRYNVPEVGMVEVEDVLGRTQTMTIAEFERRESEPLV